MYVYAASLGINITGHGSYFGSTDVILVDQTGPLLGNYGIGLSTSTGSAYFGFAFPTATPSYTLPSIGPTIFSGLVVSSYVE